MCIPLITPGGRRAYKNSKKEGYAVFIEQTHGGHTQWLPPVNETDTDGGELVFPPNDGQTDPIPQLDGQDDVPFSDGEFSEGADDFGLLPQPFGRGGLPGAVGGFGVGPPPFGRGGPPGGVGGFGVGPQPFGLANGGIGMPYVHGGYGGITGGHHGPVFSANPFIGPGSALTNWFVKAPDSSVKPWYLHPAGSPQTQTKKRKAFVVRRERPEEAVHKNGTAGPYPTVKGLGEFRGGRFY